VRRAARAATPTFFALLGLVTLGAALRLVGIGYLLPEVMNRDGMVVLRQVEILRGGPPTPEEDPWHWGFYPHVMARIAALLPAETSQPAGPVPLEEHLALASAPWIRLRVVSALLSLLAVPATYLLGRRFLDRAGSLFASALVATSLHDIALAVQEKPHATAASFITIALVAATALRRKPDVRGYLLAGVAAGLAIGSLQTGAAVLFALAAAFLLRRRDEPGSAPWTWSLATAAIVAASVRIFYPFFFHAAPGKVPSSESTTSVGGFAHMLAEGFGSARITKILGALLGLDPLVLAAAGVGALLWAIEIARSKERRLSSSRGDLPVLVAFATPYLVVLLCFRETLVRFCLPLLPLLAIAAGYAFTKASARLPRPAAIALAVVLLAIPVWPAVHFARIRTRPSPLAEAARWVEANVPRDEAVVVVPHYDLPLLLSEDAIASNTRDPDQTIWSDYLSKVPRETLSGERRRILVEPGERPRSREDLRDDPVAYLRAAGARTIVLDLSGWPSGMLADTMDLAARISPAEEDDGKSRGMVLWGTGYDPLRPSAARILGLRSVGTAVEIYRLR
jgi:hypothetical protein